MKIISASNEAFEPVTALTREANRRLGYDPVYFEIEACPPASCPERNVGRAPWKPSLICKAIQKYQEHLVWMDADAWAIRDLSDMKRTDYDVAVTMRRQKDRGRSDWPEVYGYLQAGVVFFAPTIAAAVFAKRWQNEVPNTPSNSDQHALNNLVLRGTDLTEYDRVFLLDGIRVLVLSTEEYNWCYLPEEPLPMTRVLHAKTDIRDKVNLKEWTERKFT